MAQYKTPPNPSDSDLNPKRPRHNRSDGRDWAPIIGLGLGVLVTIAGIFIALRLTSAFLTPDPLLVESLPATVIRLTAPATPTLAATETLVAPTQFPTLTPLPTPDVRVAPDVVTVGFYAAVSHTSGVGVTVRSGPTTSNERLLVAPEDEVLLVIGGPTEGSGFTWWEVQVDEETTGWIAADFLEPVPAPD